MPCPLLFKNNNLIDFVTITDNNWNNIKNIKKGCLYFIFLKSDILKKFEFITQNIDINQIHFINLDHSNKAGALENVYENIIQIMSKKNIFFNLSINNNFIKTINFQKVPDHSLLHIRNNPIVNPLNIFQSNFEILKIDWFYLCSYEISKNIKCISFYIKNPDTTFDFLLESLSNNHSLQCIELIFQTRYKITENQIKKLKTYQSITFYNIDFSLINNLRLINATKIISLIKCSFFTVHDINDLSLIKIVNCHKYKIKYLHKNTILLVNQKNYFNTNHKNTCFVSMNKILFTFNSKYYKKLLQAAGSLRYKSDNSILPTGGSNILPFIMTDAGKLSGIIQFGSYWCINHVTIAPFTRNDQIDFKSLSNTITSLKKETHIRTIIVRLPNYDAIKVIKLLKLNNMKYIIDKIHS